MALESKKFQRVQQVQKQPLSDPENLSWKWKTVSAYSDLQRSAKSASVASFESTASSAYLYNRRHDFSKYVNILNLTPYDEEINW